MGIIVLTHPPRGIASNAEAWRMNLREAGGDSRRSGSRVKLDKQTMENPWLSLCGTGSPYVFHKDRAKIDKYNHSVRNPGAKVVLDVIPEPFIGNPDSAQVVLLGLNPGSSASDPAWHAREDFRTALFLNLRHKLQDYPFYPLNPALAVAKTHPPTERGVWIGRPDVCRGVYGHRMVPLSFRYV
jgi:hypothetical protein